MQSADRLPISQIKVRVPFRRRELISRTRLIDALYEQLEKRILLIVAPAGYGKTSMLVDLAQQSELPVCWLSLDELDKEPQRFIRYLVAAIAERFPDFGRDSLAALESMASFTRDQERLLVTLTNEINALINDHFFLILDDYHLVDGAPYAGHIISRLLQLTGENVHVILASRNLPDLPDSPLLIARNQVGGLTFHELSFLPEEIQQLFQQNNEIALELQYAKSLVEQTEGWIAAIHLTNGQPSAIPRMHPLESTRELFDFFSHEVLLKQSEQLRRFLLMTAVFDTFDVGLCKKVLNPLVEGEEFDWEALFETVRISNLFCIPLDNQGVWVRYHNLFQHFLRAQLQYEQPVLAWQIQQRLAQAYEEQQAWEEALQLYAQLNDYENQARLLSEAGPVFISSGQILTLANWLEKLPDPVVYSQPSLVSLLGVIHTTKGDNRRALELYNQAELKLRESKNENEWMTTLVRRAEVYRQLGQFDQSLQDVGKILEVAQNSSMPDLQYNFAEAQRIKGLALYGLGHVKDALLWLEKSLQTYRNLGIQKNIPILEVELGVVHRRLGEPEVTARYYTNALTAWKNAGNTGWKANLLNNMGLLHHLIGKLDEALSYLEQALETAERSGYVQIQTIVLISLGDVLSDITNYVSAYDYYDRALTLATNLGSSQLIFYASLGEARLQRLSGEPLLAIEELKQVDVSQLGMGLYERALFNLELGCCWLDVDKLDVAVTVLQDAVKLFGEGGNQMELAVAQLWLEVAKSTQLPGVTVTQFKKLLPSQREWQKPSLLMVNAGRAAQWLKKKDENQLLKDPVIGRFFEQAGQIRETLLELNNKLHQVPKQQSAQPRLEIISFGDVMVRHNQRIVGISDWQTREARDLFFFLLQSPPLTKEQIALEFWPDISPARLKMRFKINIYRIRKAIEQDTIIFEDNRYRFNQAVDYSWDREKLDKLLQTLQETKDVEKINLLKQATQMLENPYLADLDVEWAVPDRLRYQDMYRDLMVDLAGLYLQTDQARACLETARLLLRFDPLLETGHRLIIQAYASLHDPAGMTLQYRQYQQILMTELGLEPSYEMNTLYEQLLDAI